MEIITQNKLDLVIKLLKGIESRLEQQEILKKEVLDFKEACQYLNVSDSFLYKKTSTGEVPFSKPNNGKIYFLKSALDEWMMQNQSVSEEDLSAKAKEWVYENLKTA